MPLTVEELLSKSKEQRGRKRYEEALVSALAAVEQDENDSEAWWQVALSRESIGDIRNSIAALRRTVELSPDASNAWARLGDLLIKTGQTEEAKDAFQMALEYYDEQTTALEGMSSILAEEDDQEQDDLEISVLERIERLSSLSSLQINRFGILNYRNGHIHEAIRCWKMEVWGSNHPSQRYNLGLGYNSPSISQDADAIDMWRLTLREWPDYEPPQKNLARVLPRLLALAERARRQGVTLLPKEQWFDHYINPFEVLNPPRQVDIDDLDAKTIQKLKRTLLHEIDLEAGFVSWMPHLVIDKSRAIQLCDELTDPEKKEWHWQVYSNKPLLHFLTTGAHEHFLVDSETSKLDTIERIEWDEDFLDWLGKFFAPQFDRVLAKAIGSGIPVIVECLLDGRRWVSAAMEADCFQNTQRAVETLVKPLSELLAGADETKPTVQSLDAVLTRGRFLEIMNLMPVFFETFQNDAVHAIRGLAVKAYNLHDDIDLSRDIIARAKRFKFRSAAANNTIEEDIKTIEALVKSERKHEAKLTSGSSRWEITKKGVQMGERFIAVEDVRSLRWGAMVANENNRATWDFLIAFDAGDGRQITFQWKALHKDLDEQKRFFEDLINAALNYILPSTLAKIEDRVAGGGSVTIGPCRLTEKGLQYEVKGWIFSDQHFTPWTRVRTSVENGQLSIFDAGDQRKRVSFSLRDTGNAHVLMILVKIKNEGNR